MEFIYPLFISFAIVFISELGDKTQLLVLSFSGKDKTFKILLGVAIGSFFSHGLAILFGSGLALLKNEFLHHLIEIITYSSFVLTTLQSRITLYTFSLVASTTPFLSVISPRLNGITRLSYFCCDWLNTCLLYWFPWLALITVIRIPKPTKASTTIPNSHTSFIRILLFIFLVKRGFPLFFLLFLCTQPPYFVVSGTSLYWRT